MPKINIEPNKKPVIGKDEDGLWIFGEEEPLQKVKLDEDEE